MRNHLKQLFLNVCEQNGNKVDSKGPTAAASICKQIAQKRRKPKNPQTSNNARFLLLQRSPINKHNRPKTEAILPLF